MHPSAESYADAFPDRLMATANDHPVVRMDIKREYIPMLAADLYRGSVIVDNFDGPFEESFGHAMLQSAGHEPVVTLTMPAPMARVMAAQIKAGGLARRALH